MRKPSAHVRSGIKDILAVLSAQLESPSESDFQRFTDRELKRADDAVAWLRKVAYDAPAPRSAKAKGDSHDPRDVAALGGDPSL